MTNARGALEALEHMGSATLSDLSDEELHRFRGLCAKWQQQSERRLLHRRKRLDRRALSYSALSGEDGANSVTIAIDMN